MQKHTSMHNNVQGYFSEYYRLFHEHHEQVHVSEFQNSISMQICLLSHGIYDLSFITVDTF